MNCPECGEVGCAYCVPSKPDKRAKVATEIDSYERDREYVGITADEIKRYEALRSVSVPTEPSTPFEGCSRSKACECLDCLKLAGTCLSCGGAAHEATGSVLPSGRLVCGPCVRGFMGWVHEHTKRRYRVGPKGKGAVYIPFPY